MLEFDEGLGVSPEKDFLTRLLSEFQDGSGFSPKQAFLEGFSWSFRVR